MDITTITFQNKELDLEQIISSTIAEFENKLLIIELMWRNHCNDLKIHEPFKWQLSRTSEAYYIEKLPLLELTGNSLESLCRRYGMAVYCVCPFGGLGYHTYRFELNDPASLHNFLDRMIESETRKIEALKLKAFNYDI